MESNLVHPAGGGGLVFRDLKVSGGPMIVHGDVVRLLYRVALSEEALEKGELLESTFSPEQPMDFRVAREDVLEGVYLGLIGMRAGGSIRRLSLSSNLAFGRRGWGAVPPNSPLVVDVLVSLVARGL